MSLYKIEIRRTVTQLLIIVLVVLQIIFIWHIDLCISAINLQKDLSQRHFLNIEIVMSNGFIDFDPLQIYHICLYGVIIVSCLLGFAAAKKSLSIMNYIKTL